MTFQFKQLTRVSFFVLGVYALEGVGPVSAGEIYGRADVGVALNDVEVETTASQPGDLAPTVTVTETSGDFGGRLGGALGYRTDIGKGTLALEGEVSFRNFTLEDTSTTDAEGNTTFGTADAEGFILPIFANVRYYRDIGRRWQPYVMAGVGPTVVDSGGDGFDNFIGLGLQFGGGVSTEIFRGIELEGGYRYVRTTASDDLTDSLLTGDVEVDSGTHEFLLGLSIPLLQTGATEKSSASERYPLLNNAQRPPERPQQPAPQASTTPTRPALTSSQRTPPPARPASPPPASQTRGSTAAYTAQAAQPRQAAPAPAVVANQNTGGGSGNFWVQVAAYQSVDVAREQARNIYNQNANVLGAGQPRIEQAFSQRLGSDIFRVQFGPYIKPTAERVCASIANCLVKDGAQ